MYVSVYVEKMFAGVFKKCGVLVVGGFGREGDIGFIIGYFIVYDVYYFLEMRVIRMESKM